MPLHPDDVVRRTFRTTSLRRGYDENDVDAFLEEVVVELRRLRRQVDEGQAEIDRMQREAPTARLAAEEQQLEQLRREREALAAELRDADQRIADAQEAVSRAESERDADLEQIKARFEDDMTTLKKRAREAREEARELVDEARQEEESLAVRLAALRADAEAAVSAELGQDRLAGLISGLQLGEDAGPIGDLAVIATLAETLRAEHVDRGLAVAQEIRVEAESERDEMIADATSRANALLDSAQQEHDELVRSAQAEHDRLIEEGKRAYDDTVGAASEEADRMVAEAREERDAVLADLTSRRDQLQDHIDDLDRFQADYRNRIRALIAEQVRILDADDWHR